MGEFEEKLNSILSSPKDMEKILGLAKELSGGENGSSEKDGGTNRNEKSGDGSGAAANFDPKLLSMLSKLMDGYSSDSDDKTALIAAIKPYVRSERRGTLDKALKIAKISHIARLAMSEFGGELDLGL